MSTINSKYYKRNKLSARMISNYVLLPISSLLDPPNDLVESLGISNEVPKLKKIYKIYSENEEQETCLVPRYLPFYRYIKENIPEFDWDFYKKDDQIISSLNKPYLYNGRPTLLNLLLTSLRGEVDLYPVLKIKYPVLQNIPNSVIFELEHQLKNSNFHLASASYWEPIADMIEKGLRGEKITIVSVICPDYSYEKKGKVYRYTFNNIGDGIGLVAQRAILAIPSIIKFFEKSKINYEVVIAGGDFEGLDQNILNKVNEKKESFFEKVKQSQEKTITQIKMHTSKDVKPFLFVETKEKHNQWIELTTHIKDNLMDGNTGHINLNDFNATALLDSRLPLYKSWHPRKTKKEYFELLYSQGSEYAAMGHIFCKEYKNPLVIGADHVAMMPFYNMLDITPILYLKKGY